MVRFFGGSMADQKPFSDDRKWDVDLMGVDFLVRILLPSSIIGYALGVYFTAPLDELWQRYAMFLIISIQTGLLTFINTSLGRKFFTLKDNRIIRPFSKKTINNALLIANKLDPFLPSSMLVVVNAYLLTSFFLSGHSVWITISLVEAFIATWLMAIRRSYHILKSLPVATVYLVDGQVLADVDLIKVNEGNVKIKTADTAMIINMNNISRIEIRSDESRHD